MQIFAIFFVQVGLSLVLVLFALALNGNAPPPTLCQRNSVSVSSFTSFMPLLGLAWGVFYCKTKPPLRWFLFCLKFLVFENQQRRSLLGEKSSGLADVLSLRKQELQSNSFPQSEIRVARKLSRLEPKVLLRNFPSVKQIQDNLGSFYWNEN